MRPADLVVCRVARAATLSRALQVVKWSNH